MPADRHPPHNTEAEQGVIGSVLLDGRAMQDVAPHLSPDDFYRSAHEMVFAAMMELADAGTEIDPTTVAEVMTRNGTLGRAGGVDYLGECVESVPHAANAGYYAQIVLQKAQARRLLEATLAIQKDIYSNAFTAEQLFDGAQKALLGVTERADKSGGGFRHLSEGLTKAVDTIYARRRGEPVGVLSGIEGLDRMLGGFGKGTLTLLGARPGQGKSALALNVAVHAALNADVPTAIFSMEMADREWGERFITHQAEVDGWQMRHPRGLSESRFEDMMRAVDDAVGRGRAAPVYLDDTSGRTAMQVVSLTRQVHAKHKVGLVIVDYLQLCDAERERDNRQEQIAKISRRLKVLARALDIPIIALSQLNRGPENREDKRPRKSDLRESGALEQDADNVLLLYCPDEANEDAEIIVDKSRNGPTGIVRARFDRKRGRFEDWRQPDPPLSAFTPY